MLARVFLVMFAATGCAATTTLPKSGLPCPDDAIARTSNDDGGFSREWCEIPSGKTDCSTYAGSCEVPGTSHGPWIRYYPNGERAEMAGVDHGKTHGSYVKYYESGKTKMVTEWRNYRREGLETRWYESGAIEWRGAYVNNRRDGVWTGWFESGVTSFRGSYLLNTPRGAWTFWNADGSTSRVEDFELQPNLLGQDPNLSNGFRVTFGFEELPATHEFWIDGHKHGPWRKFDENGVLSEVEVYSSDKRIEHWVRPK